MRKKKKTLQGKISFLAEQPLSKKGHKMSTGLQGQKILYTTLFMGKVCRKNPGFDKDKTDVMFGLTLYDCIFHFSLCTSKGIKVPFENKVMGLTHRSLVSLCRSFFPFPSFSLSVLLSGWLLGTQLYWLSVLSRKIKPCSPLCYPYRLGHHPEGTPGSYWGWSLATNLLNRSQMH